jgi:hypothetical protein
MDGDVLRQVAAFVGNVGPRRVCRRWAVAFASQLGVLILRNERLRTVLRTGEGVGHFQRVCLRFNADDLPPPHAVPPGPWSARRSLSTLALVPARFPFAGCWSALHDLFDAPFPALEALEVHSPSDVQQGVYVFDRVLALSLRIVRRAPALRRITLFLRDRPLRVGDLVGFTDALAVPSVRIVAYEATATRTPVFDAGDLTTVVRRLAAASPQTTALELSVWGISGRLRLDAASLSPTLRRLSVHVRDVELEPGSVLVAPGLRHLSLVLHRLDARDLTVRGAMPHLRSVELCVLSDHVPSPLWHWLASVAPQLSEGVVLELMMHNARCLHAVLRALPTDAPVSLMLHWTIGCPVTDAHALLAGNTFRRVSVCASMHTLNAQHCRDYARLFPLPTMAVEELYLEVPPAWDGPLLTFPTAVRTLLDVDYSFASARAQTVVYDRLLSALIAPLPRRARVTTDVTVLSEEEGFVVPTTDSLQTWTLSRWWYHAEWDLRFTCLRWQPRSWDACLRPLLLPHRPHTRERTLCLTVGNTLMEEDTPETRERWVQELQKTHRIRLLLDV